MKHSFLNSFRRDERGAAAVEFIISVPLLVLIMTGMVDIGLMVRDQVHLERRIRDAVQTHYTDGPLDPALMVTDGCHCADMSLSDDLSCSNQSATTHTLLRTSTHLPLKLLPDQTLTAQVCVIKR